jgi:queuosine precursor transporter
MKFRYRHTSLYITAIVFINTAFSYLPIYEFAHCEISAMDPVAGIIYLLRDFAQAELGHAIFFAMGIGALLSLWLADPLIAKASVYAFMCGEIIDWAVYTYTQRPLRERLLLSASISAPIDSLVFLFVIGRMNVLALSLMTVGKIAGVWVIWRLWNYKQAALK